MECQGVTTFGEFWARSANFGENEGWDESRGARVVCVVIHSTFRQLRSGRFSPNLATKRTSVSRRWIRRHIFENVHFRGHLPPKSEIENRSNRHLTQSRLQVTRCTAEIHCLLHVVVKGPRSFRGRSTFLYDVGLRSYGASKLPNVRILAYFSNTKPLKRDQPTAQGLHRRMIPIFPCGSRRSRGVPCASGVFLRLQTCPNFRLWQMAISMQNATARRVRSGPKMSENTQF